MVAIEQDPHNGLALWPLVSDPKGECERAQTADPSFPQAQRGRRLPRQKLSALISTLALLSQIQGNLGLT